jgi:hypothetical protein
MPLADKEEISTGGRFLRLVGQDSGLGIVSWTSVLTGVLSEVEAAGDHFVASDIRQLQGLCILEDSGAFLPLTTEELTDVGRARRIVQFGELADDITSRLVARGIADVKGLRATSGNGRYGRYMLIQNVGCLLHFNASLWASSTASPIWLLILGAGWKRQQEIAEMLQYASSNGEIDTVDASNGVHVAIRLVAGKEREEVLVSAVEQVQAIALKLSRFSVRQDTSSIFAEPPDTLE